MGVLKYLPTPKQLARVNNESTFLITFGISAAETIRDYLQDSDPTDPLMWGKGLGLVVLGLVQRWRSYGKESIEVDLPALAEAQAAEAAQAVQQPVQRAPVHEWSEPSIDDPAIEAGMAFEHAKAQDESALWWD